MTAKYRILACTFLSMWMAVSFAEPISLSCTLPTLNEDGTDLTDLSGIRFYESQVAGGPYDLIGDSPICSLTINGRIPGKYYYVATAYNLAGVESIYSNEAIKIIPSANPAPPTNLVVDPNSLVAYGLSQTRDTIIAYPIGTVLEGTSCDSTMQFNNKYVVPFDSVQWIGTARPEVVLAVCGVG